LAPEKEHIVIACSYLHVPGGYEKAMTTTANLFAENGYKVTLLILDYTSAIWYPVHPNVQIVHLPVNFGITETGNTFTRKFRLWNDTRKLKKVLRKLKPDHLLCTEYPFAVAAILGGVKKLCRVYSWEHHHYNAQKLNQFWTWLQRKTYKELDAVVCLNPDEQRYYSTLNSRATVIPNFISKPLSYDKTTDQPGKKYDLLSVTRFNQIKGIDLLMDVAKQIFQQSPQVLWKVIGYGEQENEFRDFIKRNKLETRLVYQPADQTDISHEYRDASIFVMTSRNECFPLVLLEAMREGLPCIAFDCDTGPRHIILHNETGLLLPPQDTEMMASNVLQLLKNSDKLKEMGARSLERIQNYYPDKIYALWQQLFEGL
jgi:glycosyltransferase involved in cell wall biosynthesis